jgi:hypothetical protein
MFDIHHPALGTPSNHTALPDLRQFVDLNTGALYDAAALLAGARGVLIVDRIVEGLVDPEGPARRTIEALRDLRDILTLEHVDDLTRPEAYFFSAIDPSEPIVEEICLLSDHLETIMSDLVDNSAQQSNDRRTAA